MSAKSSVKAVDYPSPDTLLQLDPHVVDALDFTGFPEKYGFDPKDILSRVGRIATHFASTPNSAAALAESGYYQPDLLPKTAATLRRL